MGQSQDSRRRGFFLSTALIASLAMSSLLEAQMPGVPVLQNAFANPGIAAAGNYGSGSGSSSFGGAASFAGASGRIQLSAGLGLFTPKNGNGRFAWGARAFAPLMSAASNHLGFGAFAGIGGGAGGHSTVAATTDTVTSSGFTLVPVGVSASYRMAIGTSHGFSIYGSPIFTWYNRGGTGSGTGGVFRGSVGADVGITPSIGVTLGLEFGADADPGTLGPRGTIFGAGLSFAFGRS